LEARSSCCQLIRNAEDPDFANFVNTIGDGGGPEIPLEGLALVEAREAVIDFVFPDVVLDEPTVCASRSIQYYVADSLKEDADAGMPPPLAMLDYIMRYTPPGLPHHCVSLKVGSVCRLLRNFSIDRGLVKNVRVVVRALGPRLVTVRKIHAALTAQTIPPRPRLLHDLQQLPGADAG